MRTPFLFLFLFFCPLLSAQVVLDSILSLSYNAVDTPIVAKTIYQYDDQLREIYNEEYMRNSAGNLVLETTATRTYENDKEIIAHAATIGNPEILTNSVRYTEFLNLEIGEPHWLAESWNKEEEEWENSSRTIVTFLLNDNFIEYSYDWDPYNLEYELDRKHETIVEGNTVTTILSDVDGNGDFVLDRKKIETSRPGYEFLIELDFQLYDVENEVWKVEFKSSTTIDENELTATLEYWNAWQQFTNEFIKSDSAHIILNEDLQHLEEHWYSQVSWNNFEYQRFHKFRYRTDMLKAYEEIELFVDDPFQQYPSRIDYYYSEDATVVNTQQVAAPFPADLIFANPMIDEDKIRVASADAAAMDFWLIDAQGKIVHQQSVMADDELSLAPLALSPGIYFMTLFAKEGGQKTWKLNYLK